jgi:hypothetical protein
MNRHPFDPLSLLKPIELEEYSALPTWYQTFADAISQREDDLRVQSEHSKIIIGEKS